MHVESGEGPSSQRPSPLMIETSTDNLTLDLICDESQVQIGVIRNGVRLGSRQCI
jgi:hypothetical protein